MPLLVGLAIAIGGAWILFAEPSSAATLHARDEVVLVEPNGCWHVRVNDAPDYTFSYGLRGDIPLLGDWDGDGADTPGAYRPSTGFAYLSNTLPRDGGVGVGDPALTFFFGMTGDQVMVGDWDGDGVDTLGIRRGGKMFLTNVNATSAAEHEYFFGVPQDVGFGGDPDGDGADSVFVYRPSTGFVYYTTQTPDGPETVAATGGDFFYGVPTDELVTGDWDGDGMDSAAVFRPRFSTTYLRNALSTGIADTSYKWGGPDWHPVAGTIKLPPPTATPPATTCARPIAPLTGLPGGNPEQRVVIAKFSNSWKARPQEGINDADMVMEALVEYGIGRWIAYYQTIYPETVGPLRSVREVDPKLIAPYDARVLHSGGQPAVRQSIAEVALDEGSWSIPGYRRESGRPAVYDVMYDFRALPEVAWEGTVAPAFTFVGVTPRGGEPATDITVPMSSQNIVDWDYNGGRYERSQDGRASFDSDGARITADSVVVLYVQQLDTGRFDSAGGAVPDYEVVGSGEVVVFRDGRAYPGTWQRAGIDDHFLLLDSAGDEIPLLPGRPWVHITPSSAAAVWD